MPTLKKVYPVYPETRRRKFNRRWFTLSLSKGFYHPVAILILAAITLSVAVIFYINSKYLFKAPEPVPSPIQSATKEPDETTNPDQVGANWKTYNSDSGKFSLKYPSDWSITTTSTDPDKTYISNGKSSIYWRTDSPSIDFDTLYNYPIGVYIQGTQQISSSSKIKNLKAGRYKGTMIIPGRCMVCANFEFRIIIYFEPGAPLSEIVASNNSPDGFWQKDLFIQILSTFKFLD